MRREFAQPPTSRNGWATRSPAIVNGRKTPAAALSTEASGPSSGLRKENVIRTRASTTRTPTTTRRLTAVDDREGGLPVTGRRTLTPSTAVRAVR